MTEQDSCTHNRTRLIAKDQDVEYLECVDCGFVFETAELLKQPDTEESRAVQPSKFDESLSDA
jgi:hypothetical protein